MCVKSELIVAVDPVVARLARPLWKLLLLTRLALELLPYAKYVEVVDSSMCPLRLQPRRVIVMLEMSWTTPPNLNS